MLSGREKRGYTSVMSDLPDFYLQKAFVYILESNQLPEIQAGFSEGKALEHTLKFCSIKTEYRSFINKLTLAHNLKNAVSLALKYQAPPILHISAHGSEQGLIPTIKQLVTWQELFGMLAPLDALARGKYLLCMSACHGLAAINLALGNPTAPLFGVVGTLETVDWSDNVLGFASFYHLLTKGKSIRHAVEGMKAASGNDSYLFVDGKTTVDLVQTWSGQ